MTTGKERTGDRTVDPYDNACNICKPPLRSDLVIKVSVRVHLKGLSDSFFPCYLSAQYRFDCEARSSSLLSIILLYVVVVIVSPPGVCGYNKGQKERKSVTRHNLLHRLRGGVKPDCCGKRLPIVEITEK